MAAMKLTQIHLSASLGGLRASAVKIFNPIRI